MRLYSPSITDTYGKGDPIGSVIRTGAVASGPYSALDKWRTAQKRVRTGTGNARAIGIGDSTAGGWPTSFIDRWGDIVASDRLIGGPGIIYPTDMALNTDGRVVYGSGWSNAGIGNFGPANRGVAQGLVGAVGTLDIGAATCDRWEIWYFNAGVGSFDYWIDGGAHTTVNSDASASIPSPSVITPTVALGSHILHIGNIVGNPAYIFAAEPRTGTSGLYVSRAGMSTMTTPNWASVASSFASSILMFHTLKADLYIIMLTTADFNVQTDLVSYRANIDSMVVLGQTYGSVVLCIAPTPTISTAYLYPSYITQLQSIRDARQCGLIDFSAHLSGLASSVYMGDTLHPTAAEQADMALVLNKILTP